MDPGETWVHEKEILNNWLEKREFIGAGVCRF